MTLSYSVRFQPGFRFAKGGKLPGLFGGDAGSGAGMRRPGSPRGFMCGPAGGEVYAYFRTPRATARPSGGAGGSSPPAAG